MIETVRSSLGILLVVGPPFAVLALACATAMRSAGGCSRLPTVEECKSAALRISDECLRSCVIAQCSGVTVRCGDRKTVVGCSQPRENGQVGGFTTKGGSCEIPRDELHWCELPLPASCRPLMMVHELAHSCGWKHDQGMGVPGNSGKAAWRQACE